LAYSKKDYEEITLPDGKKVKARISPPLDLDYSWNRGKHWFFRSPYRGGSPFALFLVILAVGLKYGWAAVGLVWIFVLVMGAIGITINLFTKSFTGGTRGCSRGQAPRRE
jgi:hypothetical protein